MFNDFNSWLFYLGALSGSAYLLGFISQTQKKRTSLYFIITFIALAIPVLMAAYRSCGTDSFTYMRDYLYTRRVPFKELFEGVSGLSESGYTFLTKVLGYFKSVRVFFGAYAAITVCIFYLASKEYKKDGIALSMLLFYFGTFTGSFNIMRQSVAVVLVVFSFQYVFKKDFLRFMLFVLIAGTFHTSALLVTFVYFLWTKEGKLIPGVLLFIIFVAFAAVAIGLEGFLGSFAGREFESESLQRYVGYTSNEVEAKNRDFYLTLLIAIILLVHYQKLVEVDKRNSFFIFLYLIATALALSGFVSPYAKRIAKYFAVGSSWLLADIPKCYKDHHSIWTARLLVIFYALMRFTLTAYILDQGDLIPYIWILPSWARF